MEGSSHGLELQPRQFLEGLRKFTLVPSNAEQYPVRRFEVSTARIRFRSVPACASLVKFSNYRVCAVYYNRCDHKRVPDL